MTDLPETAIFEGDFVKFEHVLFGFDWGLNQKIISLIPMID